MLIIFQKVALFLTFNLFVSLIGQKFKHDPEPLPDADIAPPLPVMSDQLSPLSAWLQSRITSLYELKSRVDPNSPEFAQLYNTVFAPDVVFYLNHKKMPQDAYLNKLCAEHFAAVAETVEWKEIMEVPFEDRNAGGGIVAGFFVATRSLRIRIRVGHAQQLSYNSFSAKIETAKVDADPKDGSRLRITEFFLTSMAKAAPLHFRRIHHE